MKKNLSILTLLGVLSVSVLAGDGQMGSTKSSCPPQQTCLADDGQMGSTRTTTAPRNSDSTLKSLIETWDVFGIRTFFSHL